MPLSSARFIPSFKPSAVLIPQHPTHPSSSVAFVLSLQPSASGPALGLGCSSPRTRALPYSEAPQGDSWIEREYPRPQQVPWRKELANSVHLIGVVGAAVQFKQLESGKAFAWTCLAVKTSSVNTTWINLTFWEDLAYAAFQHVDKGRQIAVSGRLVSDTVEREDKSQQKVYYRIVVRQLSFVERSFPQQVSGCESQSESTTKDHVGRSKGSTEQLWQDFFANPMDWWDNRETKRNPKYPDFKHKHTGEALWIGGKSNPTWVKSHLAALDMGMSVFTR